MAETDGAQAAPKAPEVERHATPAPVAAREIAFDEDLGDERFAAPG